ncbi:MAG: hypothetical protein QOJ01_1695 [Solirubrobacterales bacterium]|nr:hypothetical protein [Solirubrobacterales bacterium]
MGGATTSLLRAAPALEELGWRFVFWAPRPSSLFAELEERGLDAHGAPEPFIGYSLAALGVAPGASRRLARAPSYFGAFSALLRRVQPELVHVNSLHLMTEAAVARLHRRPVVLHVHEMVAANRKGRMARRLAHRLSDVAVGVSDSAALALSTSRHRALTVYEAAPEGPRLRREPGPQTVVGTVGVISPRKGTDLFAEAAKLVAAETRDIAFRVAGAADSPLDEAWAQARIETLERLGIHHAPRVVMEQELAALDIFALPARSDPFPLVVLEAMVAGLPVVGTRVDGIAEQLTPTTGVLVEPESPRALAEAILDLHSRPGLRAELGDAARARALEEFPIERQVAGLDAAYRQALR